MEDEVRQAPAACHPAENRESKHALNPTDPVYTPADLAHWSFRGTALAVLGHPIGHSLSPAMHNAALAVMARDQERFASWRYFRFDVPPEELPAALALFHRCGFCGLNLTVPHKVIAFDHVIEIDPGAQLIGAVNTLLRLEHGWRGYNTDGHGLAEGLREGLGTALKDADVILLGAGGAARAVAVECLQRHCASLWMANRTAARLDALLAVLRPVAGDVPVQGFDPLSPPAGLPTGALIINATSVGLHATDPLPIDLTRLPRPAGVYDIIYNPPTTPLLLQAAGLGVPHANGLSMLVHQGARALEIWTGASAPVPVMMCAAQAGLSLVN
jgi:shikimate dehydrogenase